MASLATATGAHPLDQERTYNALDASSSPQDAGIFDRLVHAGRSDPYYAPVADEPVDEQADDARGSTDGDLLDQFPTLEQQGCSVVASSDAEWVKDPDALLSFVQGEVPILPPHFGLRISVHRPHEPNTDGMRLPWDSTQDSFSGVSGPSPETELYAFTLPIAAAVRMPILQGSRPEPQSWTSDAVARGQKPPMSTVCAVHDLVPCYRHAAFLGDNGLTYDRRSGAGQRMLDSNTKASIRARTPAGHASAGSSVALRAPRPLRTAWNRQSARGLRPPWASVPLQHSSGGERQTDAAQEPEQNPADVLAGLRRAVTDFVDLPTRTAKVLRAEQVVYGWDLDALRSQLQTLLNGSRQMVRGRSWMQEAALEASGRSADDDADAELGGRGEYVHVAYTPLPLWFDLQVRGSLSRTTLAPLERLAQALHPLPAQLPLLPSAGRRWPFGAAVMAPVLLFAGLTFSTSGDDGRADINALVGRICFVLAIFLLVAAVTAFVALSYISTSDTILLAHPLVAYEATGLASDLSQDEVAAHLAQQNVHRTPAPSKAHGKRPTTYFALDDEEEQLSDKPRSLHDDPEAVKNLANDVFPRLVLSTSRGWLLAHGLDQKDWFMEHRTLLSDAFRYRWVGDLSDKLEHYQGS